MQIEFDVAGTPAEFRWDNVAGATSIRVGDETVELQSPLSPRTHVSFSLTRTWRHRFGDHDVEVEKVRPLFFAPVRPNAFTVKVDGKVVATAKGL